MAFGDIGKIVKSVGGGIFNRTLGRLTGAGISTDSRIVQARAQWSGRQDKKDWRVRLQIPNLAEALHESILASIIFLKHGIILFGISSIFFIKIIL